MAPGLATYALRPLENHHSRRSVYGSNTGHGDSRKPRLPSIRDHFLALSLTNQNSNLRTTAGGALGSMLSFYTKAGQRKLMVLYRQLDFFLVYPFPGGVA